MAFFILGTFIGLISYYFGGWRLYLIAFCGLLIYVVCRADEPRHEDDPAWNKFKVGIDVSKPLTQEQKDALASHEVNEFYPWVLKHPTESVVITNESL